MLNALLDSIGAVNSSLVLEVDFADGTALEVAADAVPLVVVPSPDVSTLLIDVRFIRPPVAVTHHRSLLTLTQVRRLSPDERSVPVVHAVCRCPEHRAAVIIFSSIVSSSALLSSFCRRQIHV